MALGWRAVAVAERNLCRCYAATLPNLPGQSRLKRRPKPASTSRLPPFLGDVWMCAQRVPVGRLSPPHFQCGDTGAHQPHRIYNNAARETGDRLEPVVGVRTYTYNRRITRWIAFPSSCVVLVDAEFAASFDVAKRAAARRVRRKRCALLRDRRHHTQQRMDAVVPRPRRRVSTVPLSTMSGRLANAAKSTPAGP
ncbi:hypothetical protein K0M31_017673 [Melipona bicolor]|uniref:Uncharacterized protein n=1 Tax=Melipona bicolor TaxID=60889 RepID=A0AA40G624_9HYME|nr:hypothetical protein K0M31_017673 [Melipona bicolor]